MSLEAAADQLLGGYGEKSRLTEVGENQVPTRAKHPGDLGRCRAAVNLRDQIEEALGVGQVTRLAKLEGDPPFWVEPDPGARGPDQGGRGVGAAHTRRRELTGKEENRIAVAALNDEGALGHGHVKHRGGQWSERWGAHGAIIASAAHRGPMF